MRNFFYFSKSSIRFDSYSNVLSLCKHKMKCPTFYSCPWKFWRPSDILEYSPCVFLTTWSRLQRYRSSRICVRNNNLLSHPGLIPMFKHLSYVKMAFPDDKG